MITNERLADLQRMADAATLSAGSGIGVTGKELLELIESAGRRTPRMKIKLSTLKEHSDRYMRRVLILHEGGVGKAAKALGIGRATMYRWCVAEGLGLAKKRQAWFVEQRQLKRMEYLGRPARTM